jgi:hypothetical protein
MILWAAVLAIVAGWAMPAGAVATGWTIQPMPSVSGATNYVYAVSCPSAGNCTAVGATRADGSYALLVEGWNGTNWQFETAPEPAGAVWVLLYGVSCTAADACTAVGDYSNAAGTFKPLAERWNGSAWRLQRPINLGGPRDSFFEAVSCTSTSACTAVGGYIDIFGKEVPLAESWNGRAWSVESTPDFNDAIVSALYGVSCTAANTCTAVGVGSSSTDVIVPLTLGYDGTSWTQQDVPTPRGAQSSQLNAVSCTSATACTAVGIFYNRAGTEVPLAETWNGTSWSTQSMPAPRGSQGTYLNDLSCISGLACEAVGAYTTAGGIGASLAERWNGTRWAVQTTPMPTGAQSAFLGAISCSAEQACTAVGEYTDSTGASLALAERL